MTKLHDSPEGVSVLVTGPRRSRGPGPDVAQISGPIGSQDLPVRVSPTVGLAGSGLLRGITERFAPCCWARIFPGTTDQVREVRQFVRQHLAGHPAAADVVAVASELAANSALHSASGSEGGWFQVLITAIDGWYAAVIVTDQGGPPIPHHDPRTTEAAESGRGLAVIRSLSCMFSIHDHDGMRSFIAVIPPPTGQAPA